MFIVWDRLFGTFAAEVATPTFGTVKPLQSFNPVWANVAPWVGFGGAIESPGVGGKLAAALRGPEWRPAARVEPSRPDVAARAKHRVRASRAARRYATIALLGSGR